MEGMHFACKKDMNLGVRGGRLWIEYPCSPRLLCQNLNMMVFVEGGFGGQSGREGGVSVLTRRGGDRRALSLRTQHEGGFLQARKSAFIRTQLSGFPHFRLPASRSVRK